MADEVALVTGGATGIGAEVCRQLAASGARVALCDVNERDGRQHAAAIGATFIPCDVTRYDAFADAVATCESTLGVPTFVHLNAGIMTVPTGDAFLAIEAVSLEQYRRIMGVNLDGVFHGVKLLLPRMRVKGGAITITASIAGLGVLPIDPLYATTKYGLIGFGRSVAAANASGNVRINVLCPGVVDTGIVPDAFRTGAHGPMPPAVMAAEAVDLLRNGANGEVRVKLRDREAFAVGPTDLGA
ncbi:MAG: SDR family oxidoreductase [Pseudomonadales bacterium]|nr:SDR family oxidoreductase [Pseudomonadales bacterium]MCP5182567.1 SDR family oxidoreductase [Pseudomonadales bacterium]